MQERLKQIEEVIARGPYSDDWESLSRYRTPVWYQDLKFGIFIHWGVYSVPAYANEWYPRNMYIQGTREFAHHVETYGPHKKFGYKDFIPLFKAEKFDPQAWADLFSEAGARYVVPVAEHHDGFQMYRSEISHWNAYEMGPHRDVLGELHKAFRERGLVPGASSHRIEHWFFLGHGKEFDSDVHEPLARGDLYWPSMPEPKSHFDLDGEPAPSQEYLEDWLVRTCELIDRYQPRILYFDWWIQHRKAKPYVKKMAAYYYNRAAEWGFEPVIDYKLDAFCFGTAVPDMERGQFGEVKPYFWQTDTAIARNSWCYTTENVYKTPQELVRNLADAVSKNGCLLLNVGPKSDGTIGPEDTAVLKGIGAWMKANGEAIYHTRTWRSFGEGPTRLAEGTFTDGKEVPFTPADFRFTTAGGFLYAIAMQASEDGRYCITSLKTGDGSRQGEFNGTVADVQVLGGKDTPVWHRDENGLHVETDFRSDMPVVLKIRID